MDLFNIIMAPPMINAFKSTLCHKVVQLSVYQIPIGKLTNATSRPGSVVVTIIVAPDVESDAVVRTQAVVDSGSFVLLVGEHTLTSVPMSPTPTVPVFSTSAPMCNGASDSALCAQMTCSDAHASTICPAKCDACVDATSNAPDASTRNGSEDKSSTVLHAVVTVCGLLLLVAIGLCVELRKSKKAAATAPGAVATAPGAVSKTIAFENPMYTAERGAPGVQASQGYSTVGPDAMTSQQPVTVADLGYMTVSSESPPGTSVHDPCATLAAAMSSSANVAAKMPYDTLQRSVSRRAPQQAVQLASPPTQATVQQGKAAELFSDMDGAVSL